MIRQAACYYIVRTSLIALELDYVFSADYLHSMYLCLPFLVFLIGFRICNLVDLLLNLLKKIFHFLSPIYADV